MRGIKIATAFGASLFVAACAGSREPPKPASWSKPNGTYESYMQDRYACLQDARVKVSGGFAYGGSAAVGSHETESRSLFMGCMGAHGWMPDPNGFAPPPGSEAPFGSP